MAAINKILSYATLLSCVLFMAACGSTSSGINKEISNSLPLEDCQLSVPNSTMQVKAHCGKLKVFENRSSGEGRQIELNFAVIPAISRNPAPDPIFFIPGGPGEAATEAYIAISPAFQRLNQKRAIILLDQRGTGNSHPLQCEMEDEAYTSSQAEEELTDDILNTCLSELDADPKMYTTSIAMDDLDQLRQELGYDQINLYGASYGTRAALVYLRQYPKHVRSIILDGAAPPNWTLGPSAAQDGQSALDMLFTRCKEDPDCNLAFPDLPDRFQKTIDPLIDGPIEVFLDDPIGGEPITFTLTLESFRNTIHMMSYNAETAALIPLWIYNASEQGDYRPIAAQTISTFKLVSQSISSGMRFSVICAEDVPFFNQETTPEGYLGDYILQAFTEICQTWPKADIPSDFKKAVQSEVPVLILSGEFDPVTPPANGELAAQTLPNSLHIIAPGMGHINIYRGCLPNLATSFIENGSIEGLDTSCVNNIQPVPFFLNFSGPKP